MLSAERLFTMFTVVSDTRILLVPAALNSKSALDTTLCIEFPSSSILSKRAFDCVTSIVVVSKEPK